MRHEAEIPAEAAMAWLKAVTLVRYSLVASQPADDSFLPGSLRARRHCEGFTTGTSEHRAAIASCLSSAAPGLPPPSCSCCSRTLLTHRRPATALYVPHRHRWSAYTPAPEPLPVLTGPCHPVHPSQSPSSSVLLTADLHLTLPFNPLSALQPCDHIMRDHISPKRSQGSWLGTHLNALVLPDLHCGVGPWASHQQIPDVILRRATAAQRASPADPASKPAPACGAWQALPEETWLRDGRQGCIVRLRTTSMSVPSVQLWPAVHLTRNSQG